MTLRCDPFLAILIRLGWTWGFGLAFWHLGTEFRPWAPGPDYWQILGALVLFGWGLWHLLAWGCSSITIDQQERLLRLDRLSLNAGPPRLIGLGEVAAVVLVPQSGPGRYALPPPRIELRLRSGEMVVVGTIATIFLLEDHAQRLALAIGCGVEDQRDEGKPDPNGTV